MCVCTWPGCLNGADLKPNTGLDAVIYAEAWMPNININFCIFSPQAFVTKGRILTIYRAQKLPYFEY